MKSVILTMVFYLFLLNASGQDFSKFSTKYKPKTLDEAVLQLDKLLHDTTKRNILSMTEGQFGLSSHFGMGTWIRNNWRLWSGGKLSNYFKSIGIFHPDDMSGIILTSYYRHLKRQDRALEKQVQYYQEYWRTSKEHFDRLKADTAYKRMYQQKIQYTLDSLKKDDIKKSVNR